MTTFHEVSTWANPIMRRVGHSGSSRQWSWLLNSVENGEIVIPEWQRGRVWTDEQKVAWCGYVLSRMPLPAVWIRQVNTGAGQIRDELLDGQQRVSALIAWAAGEIPGVLPWDGREVWCRGDMERRWLNRIVTPCLELPATTSDADAVVLYLSLNTKGTPHTDADLNKARDWLSRKEGDNG